jgi:tetratricopeptide (TPR) repeat protein
MPPGLPEGHPPIDTALFIKQLQEEAEQNPKDATVPLRLANFLYDQRQYQQAIEWYQKSLALDPQNVNARTDMGTAYFYLGQTGQALKEYSQSLAIDPDHKPTLLNVIVVNLEGTHDTAAAQRAWDRLRRLDPSNPALQSLSRSWTRRGAPAAALCPSSKLGASRRPLEPSDKLWDACSPIWWN